MIGQIRSTTHGGLVHSPEPSQTQDDRVPETPTGTSASSTPAGGSPAGKTRAEPSADPRLDTLLKLVAKTVRAKRQLDKEETWLIEENNSVNAAQRAIDEAQEALDRRKETMGKREGQAKRAREEYHLDVDDIDWGIKFPDDDRKD